MSEAAFCNTPPFRIDTSPDEISAMKTKAADIANMFEAVSLGAPQNAVGFVLWRVMHRYQREVDEALRPLDLTHLQFVTLTLVAWLARSGEPVGQPELARFGDIHPMQISNLLRALEEKKMVRRDALPGHALAKQVALTTPGLATVRRALPLVIDIQARLFGDEGRPGGKLLRALLAIDQLP
jgi:DNA-binding MarR family transcriptional regulator